MKEENPILVALDGMTSDKAFETGEALKGLVRGFKANDLLDAVGPEMAIKELKKYGEIVMADPKLHDIPNTVANRMEKYVTYGAGLVTIMAEGGIEMMKAAVQAAGLSSRSSLSKVVAVTVPTSISEEECHLIYGKPVKAAVLGFAKDALIAGVDAIVCSPQELDFLRRFGYLNSLERITPGIVPAWTLKPGDQKRTATPYDAIINGATFLVIGRAITQPPKEVGTPTDAVQRILEEIEKAREEMKATKK